MNRPIILITGAARGIGLAAARQLTTRGARVVIASRDAERAELAANEVGADWVKLDITSAEHIDAVVRTLGERYERLDVLINNGAVLLDHYQGLMDLDLGLLRESLETNVIGTLNLTRALMPLLEKSEFARVINVSSGAGQLDGEPQPWAPAYSISKTALNMVTQQLTAAWPDMMINSVCPGWCRTEMGGSDAPLSADEGADTLVWLALDAPRSLRGRFVKKREVIPW